MKQITEEMTEQAKAALAKNDYVAFFEAFGFNVDSDVKIGNVDKPNGIELESYTNAGGDMITTIDVSKDWKHDFREYVDNFDVDNEVVLWWPNGQPGKGVPFSNIREHYEDLEEWLSWMKDIALIMEGNDLIKESEEPSQEAIDAVIAWNYWCSNYTDVNVWAKEIWAGWEADHFIEKFNETKSMDQFFRQLDRGNQEKYAKYVLEHYKP